MRIWWRVLAGALVLGSIGAPPSDAACPDLVRRFSLACRDGAACDLDGSCDGYCTLAACVVYPGDRCLPPRFRLCGESRPPKKPIWDLLSLRPGETLVEEISYDRFGDLGSRAKVRCRPARPDCVPKPGGCSVSYSGVVTGTTSCHVDVLEVTTLLKLIVHTELGGTGDEVAGEIQLGSFAPGTYALGDGLDDIAIGGYIGGRFFGGGGRSHPPDEHSEVRGTFSLTLDSAEPSNTVRHD